jgi:hypothetical protein
MCGTTYGQRSAMDAKIDARFGCCIESQAPGARQSEGEMSGERDLPTIRQIIEKGDSLAGVPMEEDVAKEWFRRTVEDNCANRERGTKSQ